MAFGWKGLTLWRNYDLSQCTGSPLLACFSVLLCNKEVSKSLRQLFTLCILFTLFILCKFIADLFIPNAREFALDNFNIQTKGFKAIRTNQNFNKGRPIHTGTRRKEKKEEERVHSTFKQREARKEKIRFLFDRKQYRKHHLQ